MCHRPIGTSLRTALEGSATQSDVGIRAEKDVLPLGLLLVDLLDLNESTLTGPFFAVWALNFPEMSS